jgi:hypothetical protein
VRTRKATLGRNTVGSDRALFLTFLYSSDAMYAAMWGSPFDFLTAMLEVRHERAEPRRLTGGFIRPARVSQRREPNFLWYPHAAEVN